MENKILINKNYLTVIPNGIYKLLSFKVKLKIPFNHIDGATLDKNILKSNSLGFRFGTFLPGFYRAGTFYYLNHEKLFFNVKNSSNPVVIQLHEEPFNRLVIGVDNPREVVQKINNHIPF